MSQEGENTVAELQVNTGHTTTRVAESVLYEEEVMNDDDVSKMSIKRKSPESKPNSEQVSQVSKTTAACSSSQSQSGEHTGQWR